MLLKTKKQNTDLCVMQEYLLPFQSLRPPFLLSSGHIAQAFCAAPPPPLSIAHYSPSFPWLQKIHHYTDVHNQAMTVIIFGSVFQMYYLICTSNKQQIRSKQLSAADYSTFQNIKPIYTQKCYFRTHHIIKISTKIAYALPYVASVEKYTAANEISGLSVKLFSWEYITG